MAFPATKLPLLTEVLINGVWTDVSARRRIADGLEITRGRGDWSARAVASRGDCVFENADAYFSNRRADSPNFGLLGRNTQIRHRLRWVYDTGARTVSSGWGTPDVGPAWVTSGGSASDHSVSSGTLRQSLGSASVERRADIDVSMQDFDITFEGTNPAVATGSATARGVRARIVDSNNRVEMLVFYETANTIDVLVGQVVAGVSTNTGLISVPAVTSTTAMSYRFQGKGSRLRVKAWATSGTEPTSWMATFTTTMLLVGTMQLFSIVLGSTALPVVQTWDNIQISDYRFWGETSAFAPVWKPKGATGVDVTAPVEASGIMQRLGTKAPIRSALNRAMSGITAGDFVPIAYWPTEDGSDATQFASAVAGQPAAVITGDVTPASYEGFPGSLPQPVLNDGGQISAQFPAYTSTGLWQLQFTFMIPSTFSGDGDLISIKMAPGGTVAEIRLSYVSAGAGLTLASYNAAGTVMDTDTSFTPQRDTPYFGSLTDWVTGGDHLNKFSLWDASGTQLSSITGLPDGPGAGSAGMPASLTARATSVTAGWVFGQLALYTADVISSPSIGPNAQAAFGFAGETAADRLTRFCREADIYFDLIGAASDTALMGVQLPKTFLDLLFECADADQGILYEPRDALGLAYRTRASLYNQTGLALSYTGGQIKPPFIPVEDDQLTENDITVKRVGGSSTRVVVTTGPLSTQAPPNGVGTYDVAPEYSLYADAQTGPLAGWRAHLGTWDEPRFPTVTVDLAAPDVAGSATLMGSVPAVDLGDYLSVANPPPWLAPDLVELIAQGSRESHGDGTEWAITWNTVPAGPFKVFALDDATFGRLEGDHALNSSVTTTGTSWSVKTLSGPVLTDVDAEDGMQWLVEGELVTVTDISGTSSPQTVTVTRSVNGIVKAHAANVPVALFPAPYLAL